MIRLSTCLLFAACTLLCACDLAPKYVRSVSEAVPAQWPEGAAYPPQTESFTATTWQAIITGTKLRRVIEAALAHNQDLAAALANVASARAQYQAQRSSLFPTISANASASFQGTGNGSAMRQANNYSASLGISGFELDLWGRQKNLTSKAFEQYLSTQSGAKATKLTLVAETATAYVTLASDSDLLRVAQAQVKSSERTVALTEDLHNNGLVSGADVQNARTTLEQARSDVATYLTQVAQDRNALELLLGQPLAESNAPVSLAELEDGLKLTPAGLSSQILLLRPDVVEAEHQLKAANYDIGAARAAFFPTISLTGALGIASDALGKLFSAGSTYSSASSAATIPVLGGKTNANLAYSQAQRDYYLAAYRKAAQSAYRDVADTLARRGTIDRQRQAQAGLVSAADRSYTISDARYREGIDSFLTTLIAQRTLYSVRKTQISTILEDLSNRITLYKAIGVDDTL